MSAINPPASMNFSDVKVVKKSPVFQGFFTVNEYHFCHRLYAGGMGEQISRELFERGDAVAVLPYDPATDEVILVEQFRIGAYASAQRNGIERSPWLIECIAGMLEKNASAQATAEREAQEEAGIELSNVTPVMAYFSSPGGMSERIHLFVATVDSTTAAGIHGLDEESEDIRVIKVKFQLAIEWLQSAKLDNATTVIALQWLQLHKTRWLSSLKP